MRQQAHLITTELKKSLTGPSDALAIEDFIRLSVFTVRRERLRRRQRLRV